MVNHPRVAVIVVDWNRPIETTACLRSLRESQYQDLIVVLVDNGSDQSSESEYRDILPRLVYRRLERNRGFAAGCNAGIAVARELGADYALLLNNDAEVALGAAGHLVNCADENPSFCALTAAVYSLEDRRSLWHAGARTLVVWPFARRIGNEELKGQEPVSVDFATGCALLLRMAALDVVGEMDERFFMFSEDNDLCLRMRRAGFRVGAVPSAVVWHRVASSVGEHSPARTWLRSRSRLLYFRKHARGLYLLTAAASTLFYLGRGILAGALRGRWDVVTSLVAGSLGTSHPSAALHRRQDRRDATTS